MACCFALPCLQARSSWSICVLTNVLVEHVAFNKCSFQSLYCRCESSAKSAEKKKYFFVTTGFSRVFCRKTYFIRHSVSSASGVRSYASEKRFHAA